MLLVTLVVVGHTWTLVPSGWAYEYLYLWHIPAFVMVTGYLSRRFTYSRRNFERLLTTVLLPYVIVEGLLALFRSYVGGERLEWVWLKPHWAMWYLTALFMWRLLTPALRAMPYAVPLTVVVALLGGLVDVEWLDVNRFLALMPFFTLGLLATDEHLARLRSPRARKVAVGVLVVGVPVAGLMHHLFGTEWVYFRAPYADLGVDWPAGMAGRLLFTTIALTMGLAVLALVPRRAGWFTRLGAASLVVYLCHTFFIRATAISGFPGWADDHPLVSFPLGTLAAVALALTLAWRPVAKALEKVVSPPLP
jgi:fucose 4-O-acetylase-like acetyltransferase